MAVTLINASGIINSGAELFGNATTHQQRMALLDDLITAWGNTSGYAANDGMGRMAA